MKTSKEKIEELIKEIIERKQPTGFQHYGYTDKEKEEKIYRDGFIDGKIMVQMDLNVGEHCLERKLIKLFSEATKAERERCQNIIMDFQGEIEHIDRLDRQEFRVAALTTVLEIKKRLK